MTRRMARIAAMITTPPRITSRAAHRSRRTRRAVRVAETASGRAGTPGPPVRSVSAVMATSSLLDLGQLFLGHGGRDREVAVLDDVGLPVFGEDEPDEFPRQRVQRLGRRLVDVHVEESGQGIGA